jgi:5-methylcytosine-specific restriction endonuclease McrA
MNTKICKKCGRELPATTEFFYRDSRWKELFRSPCKECCAAKVDKEKRAEYMKEFNATHKEYLSEYHHNYNIKNNEKAKAYKKTFKEYFTEWHREYVRRNKEKVMTKQREWEIKNREKRNEGGRVHNAKRRAQKQASGGVVTASDIRKQYKNQRGKCYWCGEKVENKYHVDHVIPLSRGGANTPDNIVIACVHCNESKGAKLPHEWGNKMF